MPLTQPLGSQFQQVLAALMRQATNQLVVQVQTHACQFATRQLQRGAQGRLTRHLAFDRWRDPFAKTKLLQLDVHARPFLFLLSRRRFWLAPMTTWPT